MPPLAVSVPRLSCVNSKFQPGICFKGAERVSAWLGPVLVVQGGSLVPATVTGAGLDMAAAAGARMAVQPLQHGVLGQAVLGGLLHLQVGHGQHAQCFQQAGQGAQLSGEPGL